MREPLFGWGRHGRTEDEFWMVFWSHVNKTDTCWLWTGGCNSTGYGHVYRNKTKRLAHRLVYEKYAGTIRDGLFVLHRCDVRSCVNPSHLFLGTQKDNCEDRDAKGRFRLWNTDMQACVRGHKWDKTVGNNHVCKTCRARRARERYWRLKTIRLAEV